MLLFREDLDWNKQLIVLLRRRALIARYSNVYVVLYAPTLIRSHKLSYFRKCENKWSFFEYTHEKFLKYLNI